MKAIIFKHLSLYQTQICKGIAILFIVMHNFLSRLGSPPGHNEFTFDKERLPDALAVFEADGGELFRVFMTFLGHYGVQVFIFLSAYGLVRSIATQPKTWHGFMYKRIKQLMLPMLLVMIFYLLLNYNYDGLFSAHDYIDVIKRLLFLSNFYPNEALLVIGPWWFLSLIMQFYCLFLPMRMMQERFGNKSLAMLSVMTIALSMQLYPWLLTHDIYLNATIFGHLPEFALGMYVASLDKIKVPVWLMMTAFMSLMLGNLYYYFWFIAPLCAVIVIMSMCGILLKYLPSKHPASKVLNYIGVLSLYIFLLNGIIRELFIILLAAEGYTLLTSLIYTTAVIILCIVLAFGFYLLDTIINTKSRKTE
jgi:peptidoglycan/LPS O-acetylase OafA/YrhL